MGREPGVAPEYLASPVGVQINLEGVTPVTIADTETLLLPAEGSCVITARTPTGTTGEEEEHKGVSGMTEQAWLRGEEEAGPGRGPVVVMT